MLDRRSLLAASARVLDRQRHNLRSKADVVRMAKIVTPEPPSPVKNKERRRALHLIGRERLRWSFPIGLVDPDREWPAIFALEDLQRLLGHHLVVLEDRVQADDGHLIRAEPLANPPRLGQAFRHATGTEHLESYQDDHLALELSEGHRLVGVEPARDGEFGRGLWVEHFRSPAVDAAP